jgi:hypothetical protein
MLSRDHDLLEEAQSDKRLDAVTMTTTSAPETSLGNLLDQLVWRSLSRNHASLSQSRPLCKRYDPNVAPFGALEHQSAEAVASLAELTDPGQEVCLIDQKADLPDRFELLSSSKVCQMLHDGRHNSMQRGDPVIRKLQRLDVPHMLKLIALVFPGYFRAETYKMGDYFGIFENGNLVSMAGERMVIRRAGAFATTPTITACQRAKSTCGTVRRNFIWGVHSARLLPNGPSASIESSTIQR